VDDAGAVDRDVGQHAAANQVDDVPRSALLDRVRARHQNARRPALLRLANALGHRGQVGMVELRRLGELQDEVQVHVVIALA
jgi:hypothetical protein